MKKGNKEIEFREKRWMREFPKVEKALNLEKNLSRSETHLDFGCGRGIFANILARKFPRINFVGIDIDEEKISIANKRYKRENIVFKCSKKIKEKYDSITAIFVLHEIDKVKKILEKLRGSLNNNGKLLIYDFKKSGKENFREFYKNGTMDGTFEEEYKQHNRWTLDEFENICNQTGFKTLNIGPVNKYWLAYVGEVE